MTSIAPATATPTADLPVGQPIRHTDVYGGHGWITVEADGRYWLEHCRHGRWGTCDLGVHPDFRSARLAAMRHLRKAHRGGYTAPQRYAGVVHAGGGTVPYVTGPVR